MICREHTRAFHNRLRNRVASKEEFLKLTAEGKLGNSLRYWDDIQSLMNDPYDGPVSIRDRRENSPYMIYYQKISEVIDTITGWLQEDKTASFNDFYFNESAPDDKLIIQGEYCYYKCHIFLASTAKKPMRVAINEYGFYVYGQEALDRATEHMTPQSLQTFTHLRYMYPGATIEFSVHDCLCGKMPNQNTLIWEVRNY